MSTEQERTGEIVVKYDSWLAKLVKTHGLSVGLMIVGLWYLSNENAKQDLKIAKLENKLFDCYERQIATVTGNFPQSLLSRTDYYALVPSKKKRKKNDCTLL